MEQVSIRRRNMLLQVLWMILTLGMYIVYWFHATNREMSSHLKREDEILVWTILFSLPIVCIYAMYKEGELYEQITRGGVNRWIIFLLWIVFPPAVWFIIQRKLNELAAVDYLM